VVRRYVIGVVGSDVADSGGSRVIVCSVGCCDKVGGNECC